MKEEAMKFDDGKAPINLVDRELIIETAKVLGFGAKKYEAHNWKIGIPISRYYSALQRHMLAWNEGEDLDSESNLNHLSHAACNLMFMIYHAKNSPKLDDRYKGEKMKYASAMDLVNKNIKKLDETLFTLPKGVEVKKEFLK
jgi:hypothetical protein